jgi:gamma-glutamyl-gamma-aminobutyrate hydrolase PuuD
LDKVIEKSVFLTNSCFRTNVLRMFVWNNFVVVDKPEEAEYICFPGGQDISTELYGEENTHSQDPYARLDNYEVEMFHKFPEKKKLGICRGAQLLNVLSGGKLWQDCDNHESDHYIKDHLHGVRLKATSLHHQMMRIGEHGILLATADEATIVQGGGEKIVKKYKHFDDVEACWYPHTKSLCFQPHPELGHPEYFFNLIRHTVDTLDEAVI